MLNPNEAGRSGTNCGETFSGCWGKKTPKELQFIVNQTFTFKDFQIL